MASDKPKGKVDIGPFTMIPRRFFGSGMAQKLKPSASLLYLALCEHANREPSNTFKTSDRALASETTLGTRTICDARKKLIENKLITCDREEGQSFTCTLLPQSLEWMPLAKRLRQNLKPRALHAVRKSSCG